jgi:DNA-binding response OmpR family regulator
MHEGYDVLKAEDGETGIEKARKHKPDLILCDIIMPDLDGYQVLEEIRNDPAALFIPFIFLTVRDSTEDINLGIEMGAQDYITKPYENRLLVASIKNQLRLKEEKDTQNKRIDESQQLLIDADRLIAELKLYITELESEKEEDSKQDKTLLKKVLKKLEELEKKLPKKKKPKIKKK